MSEKALTLELIVLFGRVGGTSIVITISPKLTNFLPPCEDFYTCPLDSCTKTISKIEDDFNLKLHLSKFHSLPQPTDIVQCELCPLKTLNREDMAAHRQGC
jgi:hypothetical protein